MVVGVGEAQSVSGVEIPTDRKASPQDESEVVDFVGIAQVQGDERRT